MNLRSARRRKKSILLKTGGISGSDLHALRGLAHAEFAGGAGGVGKAEPFGEALRTTSID